MSIRAIYTVLLLASSGCALLSKADVAETRFFTLEPFAGETVAAGHACGSLRLGRIDSGAALRERMMWREKNGEVGFYEDRRWTERPDVYLRRALSHALYEEAGLRQVVTGDAPVLDVELIAFEESKGPPRVARLRVLASLRDERSVGWQETLTFEAPLPESKNKEAERADADAIVHAMSADLRDGARAIATRTAREIPRLDPGAAACADADNASTRASRP